MWGRARGERPTMGDTHEAGSRTLDVVLRSSAVTPTSRGCSCLQRIATMTSHEPWLNRTHLRATPRASTIGSRARDSKFPYARFFHRYAWTGGTRRPCNPGAIMTRRIAWLARNRTHETDRLKQVPCNRSHRVNAIGDDKSGEHDGRIRRSGLHRFRFAAQR
jgi:hypothetical protein